MGKFSLRLNILKNFYYKARLKNHASGFERRAVRYKAIGADNVYSEEKRRELKYLFTRNFLEIIRDVLRKVDREWLFHPSKLSTLNSHSRVPERDVIVRKYVLKQSQETV